MPRLVIYTLARYNDNTGSILSGGAATSPFNLETDDLWSLEVGRALDQSMRRPRICETQMAEHTIQQTTDSKLPPCSHSPATDFSGMSGIMRWK